jgi:3-dehydroquinate dehydratase I
MSAICVSVAAPTAEAVAHAFDGLELAEVRLELCGLRPDDVRRIFSARGGLVAACRPGRLSEDAREELLRTAVEAGASFVDVELDGDMRRRDALVSLAKGRGCRAIVSFHDFGGTPPRERLEETVARCFGAGADIAKIACLVRAKEDAARLLGLYGGGRPLVAVGMGPLGRITRIAAPFLGAPFTYASLGEGEETAPGQIPHRALAALLEEISRD